MKGFSLIEVLVSLVIISVGLLTLTKFQGALYRNASLNSQMNEAADLAAEKMNNLRDTLPHPTVTITGKNPKNLGITDYVVNWVVTPNAKAVSDLTQIDVTVTWTDAQGKNRALNMTSYRAEPDGD